MLCGLQDLSSLTRDRTQGSVVKAQSPNHWTTRDFPQSLLFTLRVVEMLGQGVISFCGSYSLGLKLTWCLYWIMPTSTHFPPPVPVRTSL